MDDYDVILIVILACVAAVHQIITAYIILFDDVPTTRERRLLKKRKGELTPYKQNVSARYSRPVVVVLLCTESPEGLFRSYY
jgi:hypothetical protein